jgi:hypothetical protein
VVELADTTSRLRQILLLIILGEPAYCCG